MPKFPSHLHERGRAKGWIRETLEGSLFLLIDGLIAPNAPEAAWIVKDYEDNLYISDAYGYAIPVFDQFWFSRGGFSMQANLLDGPFAYLQRDEIKHCLRAYFNGFASASIRKPACATSTRSPSWAIRRATTSRAPTRRT